VLSIAKCEILIIFSVLCLHLNDLSCRRAIIKGVGRKISREGNRKPRPSNSTLR